MVKEGLRFTSFHVGSPVRAPSRCSLLTGLHGGHGATRDNDEAQERGKMWEDPRLEGQRLAHCHAPDHLGRDRRNRRPI